MEMDVEAVSLRHSSVPLVDFDPPVLSQAPAWSHHRTPMPSGCRVTEKREGFAYGVPS